MERPSDERCLGKSGLNLLGVTAEDSPYHGWQTFLILLYFAELRAVAPGKNYMWLAT